MSVQDSQYFVQEQLRKHESSRVIEQKLQNPISLFLPSPGNIPPQRHRGIEDVDHPS